MDTTKLIENLIAAQKEIENANRTAVNDFFKSRSKKDGSPYATLEDVIEAVKDKLLKHGVCIETVFYGHGAELSTGKLFVPADKQTPQGYGSALTYARRYSLSLACGIGADDDDGNKATQAVKENPESVAKDKAPKAPAKKKSSEDTGLTLASDSSKPQVVEAGDYWLPRNEGDAKKFVEKCKEIMSMHDDMDKWSGYYRANAGRIDVLKDNYPDLYEEIGAAFTAQKMKIQGEDNA
jgi:hypothetical protein